MRDRLIEARRGDLILSTDRLRLDIDAVLVMLQASHWGGVVTREILERSVENSVCVGVYRGDEQLAFARAVTDLATYAYLTDVIVATGARGNGLGSWMVETFLAHPDLQGLRRVTLLTRDAQSLYEKFGFSTNMPASTYMEIRPGPDHRTVTARRIVGFHQDEEQHWVADLECGHTQHVRHDPPWQVRPWVTTLEGRQSFLGATLNCVECDRTLNHPPAAGPRETRAPEKK